MLLSVLFMISLFQPELKKKKKGLEGTCKSHLVYLLIFKVFILLKIKIQIKGFIMIPAQVLKS